MMERIENMSLMKAKDLAFLFRKKNNNGGIIVIRSKKTNRDFTFKVNRSQFGVNWYTHVKVEVAYDSFERLGSYFKGAIWAKRQIVKGDAAAAISWLLKNVEDGKYEKVDRLVDIMNEGSCVVCGKKLTDATSIEMGVGPVCRKS